MKEFISKGKLCLGTAAQPTCRGEPTASAGIIPASGKWAACRTVFLATLAFVLLSNFAWSGTTALSTLDGGGQSTTSPNYTMSGSVSSVGGVSSAVSPPVTVRHGYIGQLYEVTNLVITASPAPVSEGSNSQLTATATLDDGTVLVVAGSNVSWGAATYPIASINADGLLTAASVSTDTDGTVSGYYLGASNVFVIEVTQVPSATPPVANFTAAPTIGAVPLAVDFTDTSTGTITNRAWNFGDGGSSAAATVVHSYNSPGVYLVSLSVFGPAGTSTLSQNNLITVTNDVPIIVSPPVTSNTLGVIDGVAVVKLGQTIGFSVGSYDANGNPLSCLWNFCDGSTSADCEPTHVFTNCGPYDVSATISNGFSSVTTGMTVAVSCPMTVTSLKLQAKFKRVGADTCAVSGILTAKPADFSVANAAVTLDVGDAPVAFQLNAKGHGTNRNGNIKFSYNKNTGDWQFTGKLKGDLKGAWAIYGITNGIVRNSDVTLPILLQSNTQETFDDEPPLIYDNKSGASGSATYLP